MSALWEELPPPTIGGGTGGSGTRVITEVLSEAGVFMGSRVNRSGDALPLADFDWSWGKRYIAAELSGKKPPLRRMRRKFDASVREHLQGYDPSTGAWGWKHPHAYLLLPWLDSLMPRLRFIHLVRDGRRVARSKNQKQPGRYADVVFGAEAETWDEQVRAIKFWSWANEHAAEYGERHMDGRYLRARLEDICADPRGACGQLIEFAFDGSPASEDLVARAAERVKTPPQLPADDEQHAAQVEQAGLAGLRRFGYV
ncbi:MAG TPA: sulfotransferase [Solirubrobacteraceae bacterium]|nr:sulfotransferase [Solirubrobacteraceae bacterium]